MYKYLALLAMLTVMVSPNANADCTAGSCSNVYIEQLYLRANGDHLVQTSGDESKLACNANSNVFIAVLSTSENKKDMFSALLAAQLSGKTVMLRTHENPGVECYITYMTLNRQ